jgi:hypothetical protein
LQRNIVRVADARAEPPVAGGNIEFVPIQIGLNTWIHVPDQPQIPADTVGELAGETKIDVQFQIGWIFNGLIEANVRSPGADVRSTFVCVADVVPTSVQRWRGARHKRSLPHKPPRLRWSRL